MRKGDLPFEGQPVAAPNPEGRRGPLSNTVHSPNGGFLEWARKKRTCSMAFVVAQVDHATFVQIIKFFADTSVLPQLFAEPERHRFLEGCETFRGKRQICFQKPIEFGERLFVTRDVINVLEIETRGFHAIVD